MKPDARTPDARTPDAVGLAERRPDFVALRLHRLHARERPPLRHPRRPPRRSAAAYELGLRAGCGQTIQLVERHQSVPNTRSRAMPPSGKMVSRTYLAPAMVASQIGRA